MIGLVRKDILGAPHGQPYHKLHLEIGACTIQNRAFSARRSVFLQLVFSNDFPIICYRNITGARLESLASCICNRLIRALELTLKKTVSRELMLRHV